MSFHWILPVCRCFFVSETTLQPSYISPVAGLLYIWRPVDLQENDPANNPANNPAAKSTQHWVNRIQLRLPKASTQQLGTENNPAFLSVYVVFDFLYIFSEVVRTATRWTWTEQSIWTVLCDIHPLILILLTIQHCHGQVGSFEDGGWTMPLQLHILRMLIYNFHTFIFLYCWYRNLCCIVVTMRTTVSV